MSFKLIVVIQQTVLSESFESSRHRVLGVPFWLHKYKTETLRVLVFGRTTEIRPHKGYPTGEVKRGKTGEYSPRDLIL